MIEVQKVGLLITRQNIKYVLCWFFFVPILTLCLLYPFNSFGLGISGGVGATGGVETLGAGSSVPGGIVGLMPSIPGATTHTYVPGENNNSIGNTRSLIDNNETRPEGLLDIIDTDTLGFITNMPDPGRLIITRDESTVTIGARPTTAPKTTKDVFGGIDNKVGRSGKAIKAVGTVNGVVNQLSHEPSVADFYNKNFSIATLMNISY